MLRVSDDIYSEKPKLYSVLADSENWGKKGDLSFEAWIKPDKQAGGGARIIDKITPGGSNGFLLDTHPGNSLRLIVGSEILNVKNCLEADKWSHVAVVVDSKHCTVKLYLDGKQVAGKGAMEYLDDASTVTRAYALQRFIDACGSRGEFPVKFNGSIFTVDFNGDPDDRRWGQGYWWQNSRLPYISMPMSGDFDLMKPLMRMYVDDIFPLCEYRTKKYFGFEGAYFGECMYPWGAIFSNTYGWDKPYSERKDPLQRSMWHKWEWVAGPELVFMLMDYCEYTGDEKYLVEKVVPIAEAIMSFFENYYKVNDAGKLVMYPSQAVETWIECTNPMPEVAGLRSITQRLLGLDKRLTNAKQRARWKAFMSKLPAIPTRETEDGVALAPAEKFARKINVENPELYAVFPFRQIAVGYPNTEWGVNALKYRWDRGASGWRQDDIFMAYLGLTDQVKANLVSRARNYDKNSRFPAFWGPNYDWIPDQDHGGVLMKAFQSMLMQVDPYSRRIYLLPAWPEAWDVEFKLHAPYKTVIECSVKNGKLVGLKVDPQSRRKDVIVADPYE
ncbi:MAG: LamG domain-containing protein [Anaerohalosphaera sp.]|nr:LamG domain-containing protein [Anaerohalosphaera sp.]